MRALLGGLAGGTVGFLISALVYVKVNPTLEAASGFIRELQGLLWNIVPLCTAAGFLFGMWVMNRPSRRSD